MKTKGIAALVIYSILIGTLGFFTRMIDGMDMITIVFFRALLAALFIFGFAAATKSLKDLIPYNIGMHLVSGFCQCGMMVLFIGAVLNTSITNAVFLNHSAPVFALLFSWVFLKEKVSHMTLVSIIVSGAGVMLMLDFSSISFGSGGLLGDLMALGSGICYAGAMVSSKSLTRTNSTTGIVFWQMVVSTAALLPFIQIPSTQILLDSAFPLIGIGCIASGAGFLFFMIGVKNLSAQTVLIIPSLGLVIPAVGAWLFYSETLVASGFIGCGLILIGIFASQLKLQNKDIDSEMTLSPASIA